MSDVDSKQKKRDSERKPDDASEQILVNQEQTDVKNSTTHYEETNTTKKLEPWKRCRCRFYLWREKRKVAKLHPRDRAKWTDIGNFWLTIVIAAAAICSAWFFEVQLTLQ